MKESNEGNRCERNRFFITRRKINPVRLRLSAVAITQLREMYSIHIGNAEALGQNGKKEDAALRTTE